MTTRTVHTFLLAACFVTSAAFAAADGKPNKGDRPQREGGGLEFILEHAKDLALTDDEKTKLTDLNSKIKKAVEKAKDDPEIKDLGRELYELRESGADEEAIRPTR